MNHIPLQQFDTREDWIAYRQVQTVTACEQATECLAALRAMSDDDSMQSDMIMSEQFKILAIGLNAIAQSYKMECFYRFSGEPHPLVKATPDQVEHIVHNELDAGIAALEEFLAKAGSEEGA